MRLSGKTKFKLLKKNTNILHHLFCICLSMCVFSFFCEAHCVASFYMKYINHVYCFYYHIIIFPQEYRRKL